MCVSFRLSSASRARPGENGLAGARHRAGRDNGRVSANSPTEAAGDWTAESRLRFLADATDLLARSLDYEETLARVARLAVPALADWCIIDELREDGELARVAAVAADPRKQDLIDRLRDSYPLTWDSPQPAARAVRSGEPVVLGEVTPEVLAASVQDDDHRILVAELDPRFGIAVPLVAHDRVIGAMSFAFSESGRRYGEEDVKLAEQLARRGALALDRARLYRREREARVAAEAAQEQVTFLARATELLAESLDLETTLGSVADLAVPRLADWCIVYVVTEEAEIRRLAVAHVDERTRAAVEAHLDTLTLDPEAETGVPRVIRTGEPELVPEASLEELAADVHDPEAFARVLGPFHGEASWICVPLVAHGRTLGALALISTAGGRRYDAESLALAGEVARRAALAVDQARLYRSEQRARLDSEAAGERLRFLAETTAMLGTSLDYETTLERLTRLVVPALADCCVVDVLDERRQVRQVAVAHVDPEREALVRELEERYPTSESDPRSLVGRALREATTVELHDLDTGVADIAQDAEHARGLAELGLVSGMIVPLIARGQTLGAITLLTSTSRRRYGPDDLTLAEQLASRAAIAVDNARLYREAAERGQAARALATVADGVLLLDAEGIVRLWNPGAERITGLAARDVLGRPAGEAIPGWTDIEHVLPVAGEGGAAPRAQAVPLDVGDRELWLSFAGVGLADGTVFTFRDLTEERRLEEHRSEFVATASHELRTPLAAVYGAAVTLRREDIALSEEEREILLAVIADESDRLAQIVNDILWASRVDSSDTDVRIVPFDARTTARRVVESAQTHLPEGIEVVLEAPDDLPRVAADEPKLAQVLTNLVDNAVKYSPDGGRVAIRLEPYGSGLRLAVEDEGLGIPPDEWERIFEKFYRLDPNLTRGVGGTGLGLYICRALVERMGGRISVHSVEGRGSTFNVELPLEDEQT
jgi:signal transduction histidine kinase